MQQLFVRNTATRAIALAVACALLLGGALGLRHQADGLHVRDQRTGVMLHAQAMCGTHVETTIPDIHGRAGEHDADDGACSVDQAIHQAATHAIAAPALHVPVQPLALASTRVPGLAVCLTRVLTDAPKTSPPLDS